MADSQPVLESWVEIMPPLEPAVSILPVVLVIAASLVALCVIAYLFYRQPVIKARLVLYKLSVGLSLENSAARKNIAVQLNALLRGVFAPQLQQVRFTTPLQQDWEHFLRRLNYCCYADAAPGRAEIENLLQETRQWLKRGKGVQ
ncbi:MAG: hypothetical protein OEZ39_12815 [Gammaproteobacteria bacterium]|nr:hypothetical protein [Gammaproteobacteria bacterium]MDH5652729.1 hypothetical protein [Gammaproteobacteria bacterium]